MAFKKNSKQENENKNKVTDSNALSKDELSNVSGGLISFADGKVNFNGSEMFLSEDKASEDKTEEKRGYVCSHNMSNVW